MTRAIFDFTHEVDKEFLNKIKEKVYHSHSNKNENIKSNNNKCVATS
jgi:hypothetical protein